MVEKEKKDELYILQIHKYVSYTGDKKTPKDTMLPASKSQSHETFVCIYVHISKMVIIHIYMHLYSIENILYVTFIVDFSYVIFF